jgi:hypothetical protein
MNPQIAATLRKRILMFYFAGGANIVMALLVLAAGGGTTGIVAMLVFFAFAVLQFYMARTMQKRWRAMVSQQPPEAPKE